MDGTLEVEVSRYDPAEERSYTSSYELDYRPGMTALEVLEEIRAHHDPSLAFRSSCGSGKCGSCAVSLDGESVLACRTIVESGKIKLGPLKNFPVAKDLIVDRSQFEEGQKRALDYSEGTEGENVPAAGLAEGELDYSNLSKCIGCMVCESTCPIAGEMKDSNWETGDKLPDPSWLTTIAGSGIRFGSEDSLLPIEDSLENCSLCESCERACPSGVDLSKMIAEAKKAYREIKGGSLQERLITRPDYLGKLASIVPGLSNRVLSSGFARKIVEDILGVDKRANLFSYSTPFERWFKGKKLTAGRTDEARKVAYFVGCYNNYSDTKPAKDTVEILDGLGIYVEVPEHVCCGMPSLGKGNLEQAKELARINIKAFSPYLEMGYDVVTTCTSGSLMLKEKYTEVLDLDEAKTMSESTYDLGEYLRKLKREGEIEFRPRGLTEKAAYHTPCHLKSQDIGRPFIDLLSEIPGLELNVLDTGCCGLSGSYGYDRDNYDISQGIAEDLYESLNDRDVDLALSECGACQLQMEGGTELPIEHPVSLLRRAMKETSRSSTEK